MKTLLSNLKLIIGSAVAMVLATVGVMTFFVEQADFDAFAEQVAAQSAKQQAVNIRSTIMLEIRFLQAQRREAKADGKMDEVQRLTDEIETLKLQLEALKTTE